MGSLDPPILYTCVCRVEAIPSLALLAAQFLLHVPADVSAPLRLPLVAALAPWAMTHQHAPRAMAVMVLEVWH